jgi:hypothetical protein
MTPLDPTLWSRGTARVANDGPMQAQGWSAALDELALEAGPERAIILVDDGATALVCDRVALLRVVDGGRR